MKTEVKTTSARRRNNLSAEGWLRVMATKKKYPEGGRNNLSAEGWLRVAGSGGASNPLGRNNLSAEGWLRARTKEELLTAKKSQQPFG